jgi:MFS family permease
MKFAFAAQRLPSLSWRLLPICMIALVIGFTGELVILGPNIALERNAAAAWAIGSSTALQACGIVASTPLAVYLLGRIGSAQVFAAGGALCSCALAALLTSETAVPIAIYRFVFAIGLGLLVVVSQHVVIARAPAATKATTLAIFASFISIGSALVPACIRWAEPDLALVYAGGLLGVVIATLCARSICRSGRSKAVAVWQPWAMISRIGIRSFSSGIVYGVLTNGFCALLANYAMRVGYSVADASTIVMAGLLGTFVLEVPLGWLCDWKKPSQVIGACAAILIALLVLVLVMKPGWLVLLTLAFFVSGLVNAFYIVGLVEMTGMRPADLASGTACFILACGLGEMAGPLVGGFALEAFGSQGFVAVFLAILIAYFAARTAASSGRLSNLLARTHPAPPLPVPSQTIPAAASS